MTSTESSENMNSKLIEISEDDNDSGHWIEDLKNSGKKVGVFPVDDDDWIDIGQWAEYKKAIDKF